MLYEELKSFVVACYVIYDLVSSNGTACLYVTQVSKNKWGKGVIGLAYFDPSRDLANELFPSCFCFF